MKKKLIIFFILILVVVSSGFAKTHNISTKHIDKNLIKSFDSGEDKVKVIIEFEETDNKTKPIFSIFSRNSQEDFSGISNKKIRHRFNKSFSAEIDEKDLEKLKENPQVKSVIKMEKIHAFLQDSVTIINATNSRNLQYQEINITGARQSVCVIDSGINFSHPDLVSNYLDGYDFVDSDSDPSDGHGHGTHVAGIVAGNGGIKGIATDSGIVALRVLNNEGTGYIDDLITAIDWCVNNASQFNISVISLSLGCNATIDGYTSYCDTISDGCANTLVTTAVNNAIANNISVIAATGNFGNSTAISSPACIQNSTPVSSTTKADAISSFSDRNSLVKLFAPGSSINSTRWSSSSCSTGCSCLGNYMVCSGTSMAAPMVAGATAIINQFLNLSSQKKTPNELETIFYNTGLQFTEGLNNFSRINIYEALLSLDNIPPNITLVTPANNNVDPNTNKTFTCNATDWQLANITLQVWNSTNLYYQETKNISGTGNQSSFNLTNISGTTYSWNCLSYDVLGNSASALSNNSFTIGGISVTLLTPTAENYTNTNETNFTCQTASETTSPLSNVSFYLWNETGNLSYTETKNISGLTNSSNFNYTLINEGNYSWNCFSVNNKSNSSWATSNYTLIYDVTLPIISNISKTVTTTTAIITWTTNEASNSSINSSSFQTNSSNYVTSHSLSLSGLSASTSYNYNITSCDMAGNCNSSSDSFTTNSITITSTGSSSSGGGGGGSSQITNTGETINKTLIIEERSFFNGIDKYMGENESITFGLSSGNHSLFISKILDNSVTITIQSNPITLTLSIGEERKLNLSSPEYYDLYIKLNNINETKANLTIKRIFEEINYPREEEFLENKTIKENPLGKNLKERLFQFKNTIDLGDIIIAFSLLILAFVIYYTRKRLKRSKTLKENKIPETKKPNEKPKENKKNKTKAKTVSKG